jgi:hypothetical protein
MPKGDIGQITEESSLYGSSHSKPCLGPESSVSKRIPDV